MLTQHQRSRAATTIALMAAAIANAETEDVQHGVAYSMQEFALMLLGEGNEELTPADKAFLTDEVPDGKFKIIVVAPDSVDTLLVDDTEIHQIANERNGLRLAPWLRACGEMDLEAMF